MAEGPHRTSRIDREAVLAAAGPRITELQSEVRGAVRGLKAMMAMGFIVPLTFVVSFFVSPFGPLVFFVFFGFVLSVMIVGVMLAQRIFKARSRVMEAIAPALGLSFAARAAEPFDLSAFDGTYYASLLKYSRAQDVLSGVRDGVAYQIFDAVLTARSKGPDGKWRYGHPPKWLEGFAFQITRVVRVEVAGRWTSRTVIVRDAGVANRLYQPKGMEPVRLVDARFEKTFEVFSTDQTEARALVHPAFMERLQELEDIFASSETPAVAAFREGALFVALPLARSEEEGNKLAKGKLAAVDDYVVDRILWEIDAVMGVVDAVAGPAGETGA